MHAIPFTTIKIPGSGTLFPWQQLVTGAETMLPLSLASCWGVSTQTLCNGAGQLQGTQWTSREGSEILCELVPNADSPPYHIPILKSQCPLLGPGSNYTYPSVCFFLVTKDQGREWQPETGTGGSGTGGWTGVL